MSQYFFDIFSWTLISSGLFSTAVILKSILHFSRTGPQIQDEIRQHYSLYTVYALARLYFFCLILCFVIALPGTTLLGLYLAGQASTATWFTPVSGVFTGFISISLVSVRQFLHYLFYNPGLIITSLNFDPIRLNPLFDRLTKPRLLLLDTLLLGSYLWAHLYLLSVLALQDKTLLAISLSIAPLIYITLLIWLKFKNKIVAPSVNTQQAKTSVQTDRQSQNQPNIIMIGSDTLRADHLGVHGYKRQTTPFIDELANSSVYFKNCFVPIARTAPSLTSIFTGCWPRTHKIKTNYCSQEQVRAMKLPGLGKLLMQEGYQTSVISDWAGSDFGKFDFGFRRKDVPLDQWNLKYLIRQGPKDIRLLLSLFCHNTLGKRLLPEIYFLAGVPLTEQLGQATRREINVLAKQSQPFLLNVFMGTTHPPFASNYPFYSKYADKNYTGKSRFCMSRLTTPEEIIESQLEPREAFDLDQVIALYDGSIRQFDSEVEKIVGHLEKTGLNDNTIVVIYSDHGIDFFEGDTWGQGNSISSDASAKTPLIIRAPGINNNRTVSDKVRSIDILPTVLDLAGVTIPEHVEGVSLAPVLHGEGVPAKLPIIFETGLWLAPPPKQRSNHLTYPDIFHLIEIPDKECGTLALKDEYAAAIENARDWFVWTDDWLLKCYPLDSGPQYELTNTTDNFSCKNNIAQQHQEIIDELVNIKSQKQ